MFIVNWLNWLICVVFFSLCAWMAMVYFSVCFVTCWCLLVMSHSLWVDSIDSIDSTDLNQIDLCSLKLEVYARIVFQCQRRHWYWMFQSVKFQTKLWTVLMTFFPPAFWPMRMMSTLVGFAILVICVNLFIMEDEDQEQWLDDKLRQISSLDFYDFLVFSQFNRRWCCLFLENW